MFLATTRARTRGRLNLLRRSSQSGASSRQSLLERPSVVLLIFLAVGVALMSGPDLPIGVWMSQFPHELNGIAQCITGLGEGTQVLVPAGLVIILAAIFPFRPARRQVAVFITEVVVTATFVFAAVAGGGLLAALVKYSIGRARPVLLESQGHLHFAPFSFDPTFAAFPSGHAATAGAISISLSLAFPSLRPLLLPTGVLICLSRQFVGAHWASDIVVGWAVGAAFTLWLAHRFAERRLLFHYDADGRLRRKGLRHLLPMLRGIRAGPGSQDVSKHDKPVDAKTAVRALPATPLN
jgi:membrane-associated phospholipid phosphatase